MRQGWAWSSPHLLLSRKKHLLLPGCCINSQKEEALLTQNNEEAPEVKKSRSWSWKETARKDWSRQKDQRTAWGWKKKKEAEEAERKRIEAEQKRQADIMNKTRDALANSKMQAQPQKVKWSGWSGQPGSGRQVRSIQKPEVKAAALEIRVFLMILEDEDFSPCQPLNMITRVKGKSSWSQCRPIRKSNAGHSGYKRIHNTWWIFTQGC